MQVIDIYLGSKELKKLIVKRSFDLELPLKLICLDLGIDYKEFMSKYINSHENNNYEISEELFEKILSHLGISVRHQFVIDTRFDAVAKQEYLRDIYNKKYENTK